ncbi:MAG: DUF4838 domain-containing protein, partial [Candidatus Latescibacteria bacterium]|nr:DUF4838 domain-containing protein [Candidatus Latescibacterota bacterium]
CRWYVPGPLGEHIPKRETVAVGSLNMQKTPDFESITGFGRDSDTELGDLWARRNRLDGFPMHFHSHNWHNIVPPDMIDENPELFGLLGAKRTTIQLCTTNPEVVDFAADAARRYFDKNPDAPSFSLSPNDNMSFCQCENCRALDAQIGIDPLVPGSSITDRLVHFFNKVAVEVEKTHPHRRLAFYAYLNHTEPPQTVTPHPLLLPVLVHTPWDYCMHHPIDDPDCERNRRFAEAVVGWHQFSPQLYLYDYWAHYYLCGHHGVVHNIKRDLPWLHRNGVVGFYGEMHPQRWTQPLNFYVPTKLGWDVDADVDTIVQEFYTHMFGPAAPQVTEFGQMFEDVMSQVPKDAEHDYERAFVHGMTLEFFAKAGSLLVGADDIIQKTSKENGESDAIQRRIERYRIGLRLTEQLALEKQNRFAGRMIEVIDHLEALTSLLDEIAAKPELDGMISLFLAQQMTKSELDHLPSYREVWEQAIPSEDGRTELTRKLDEGRTAHVAQALGYWTDWHIVGLWTNPGGDPMDTHYPPEDGIDLDATYEGRSGQIRWQQHKCDSGYGIVDIRKHFFPEESEYTVAYAYTSVVSNCDSDVRMDVTCDDDIVVWVNNEMEFAGGAVTGKFDIHFDVRLNSGTNTVLAKILNRSHAFDFSVRLVDNIGQPHCAIVWT